MSLRRESFPPGSRDQRITGRFFGTISMINTQALKRVGGKQAGLDNLLVEIDRVDIWLASRVKAALKEVVLEPVTLTPMLADALLKMNPDNRNVSDIAVANLTRDIIEGRFIFNGEPIIISREGFLNDGQHRCRAVIAAGLPIRTVIAFGFSRESRFTLDQGKIKTAGDYLSMNSHVEANVLAAVASYVWQYKGERAQLSGQSLYRPTKAEILVVADHYPDLAESIAFMNRKGVMQVGGKTILAFCHWCFVRKTGKPALVGEFFDSLITGGDLASNSPILYARNRLMAGHRFKPNEKAQLIFRAWNAYRKRQNPKTLVIGDGALPAIEG